MNELSLNVSRTIHAPIEQVFDAWLDPEMLTSFILPIPGMPKPEVKNDAKQGGRFTILMFVGEDKISHSGTYLEIDRPNKLVFTWESPFSIEGSTVTINFKKRFKRETYVEINHVIFQDEESRSNHEGGWGNILDQLDVIIN